MNTFNPHPTSPAAGARSATDDFKPGAIDAVAAQCIVRASATYGVPEPLLRAMHHKEVAGGALGTHTGRWSSTCAHTSNTPKSCG